MGAMKQVRGIWLPATDEHLAAEIALEKNEEVAGAGTYQLNKYRKALSYVTRRGHAVDVGANVGLWSRVMAMDFRRVTAIEPVPLHLECFQRNVSPKNVKLLPFAVGAVPGRCRMEVPLEHIASAHVSAGEDVEVVALDDLPLGPVDFLKIDVEGYELDVIKGGEETIRTRRPVMIVEQKAGNAERYGIGQWDAVNLLKRWGMREANVIGGDHIMVW